MSGRLDAQIGADMNFNELTKEQQEKARACKTAEDMLELAKQEGYTLSDEELKAISGGVSWDCVRDCPEHMPCPQDHF